MFNVKKCTKALLVIIIAREGFIMQTDERIRFRNVTYPGVKKGKYIVSDNGTIINVERGNELKQSTDKDGYYRVSLQREDGTSSRYGVSRIVAWEYWANRDISLVVDHKDGNKQNNYYMNLEWVTVKENTRRAEAMGLRNVRGSSNGHSKYTEAEIHNICRLLEEGFNVHEVCRILLNLPEHAQMKDIFEDNQKLYTLVRRLKMKELWPDIVSQYKYTPDTHDSPKIFKPHSSSIFTEEKIHHICSLYEKKKSIDEILEELNITRNNPNFKHMRNAIYSICNKRSWKYISDQYNFPAMNGVEFFDVARLYDEGYTLQDIKKYYNADPKVNNGLHSSVCIMYNKVKLIKKNTIGRSIYLDIGNLESLKKWAYSLNCGKLLRAFHY